MESLSVGYSKFHAAGANTACCIFQHMAAKMVHHFVDEYAFHYYTLPVQAWVRAIICALGGTWPWLPDARGPDNQSGTTAAWPAHLGGTPPESGKVIPWSKCRRHSNVAYDFLQPIVWRHREPPVEVLRGQTDVRLSPYSVVPRQGVANRFAFRAR